MFLNGANLPWSKGGEGPLAFLANALRCRNMSRGSLLCIRYQGSFLTSAHVYKAATMQWPLNRRAPAGRFMKPERTFAALTGFVQTPLSSFNMAATDQNQ